MRLGLILAAVSIVSLAACSGEEEEATPRSIGDLSAREILDRVVDAASSLASIREERSSTSITHELPPFMDFPEGVTFEGAIELPQESTTRTLRIQVGEDSYTRYMPDRSDVFCDGAPETCEDISGFMDENLTYRGRFYFHDPESGEWVDEETCYNTGSVSGCSIAIGEIEAEPLFEDGECPAAEHWSGYDDLPEFADYAIFAYYAFDFDSVQESKRLGDEVSDGTRLIHIGGTLRRDLPDPYDPPEELAAIYEECGVKLPTPDPEFERLSTWMPDRNEGEFELWVDEDFHIRQLVFEIRSYNGDRLIQTEQAEADFSLFNEAELPGPLPSS